MQSLSRRPAQSLCIFCASRSAAGLISTSSRFSTAVPAQREAQAFRKHSARSLPGSGGNIEFLDDRPRRRGRRRKDDLDEDLSRLDAQGRERQRHSYGEPRGLRNRNLRGRRDTTQNKDERIRKAIGRLRQMCMTDPILGRLEMDKDELQGRFTDFADDLTDKITANKKNDELLDKLRSHADREPKRLEMDIKLAFMSDCLMARFSKQDLQQQSRVANLQYPSEWFPATRGRQREFHLHVGPTNSGKTYHALKRLQNSESGLYAGPLRLLAHEVYMRLNASGKRCNLVTGDERRTADDDPLAPMTSCTVEMVPLNSYMDVAVIDEIQVMGSEDRGWAWTQALLGVQAGEVHLCGEERAVPIVKELVALCGENLTIHKYERLSPLKMASRSLDGNINKLQKGDCVVCFSVVAIHGLRQLIEKTLKCQVAVIYGSLPPETRAQQARLFNDPDNNYDILVASDAVGMGLNLSIKRMIFQSANKFHAGVFTELYVHEVKQIAGRAGRYSTAESDMKKLPPKEEAKTLTEAPAVGKAPEPATPAPTPKKQLGLVTSLEKYDYPTINRLMNSDPMPITSAGLFPPTYIVERFVRYFPMGTPFSFVLTRLHEIATTNSRFHLCDLKQQLEIADAIEDVEDLSTTDRIIFCSSPADPKKPGETDLINAYARIVSNREEVTILDVPELDLELLSDKYTADRGYLQKIERLHKGVVIWMWLSYRFKNVFTERELSIHVKELVEARIEETLAKLSFDFQKMRKSREQAIMEMLKGEKEPEATTEGKNEEAEAKAVTRTIMPDVPGWAAEEDAEESSSATSDEILPDVVRDAEEASEDMPVEHPSGPFIEEGRRDDRPQHPFSGAPILPPPGMRNARGFWDTVRPVDI